MKLKEKAKQKMSDHPFATSMLAVTGGFAACATIGALGYKLGKDLQNAKLESGLTLCVDNKWLQLTRPLEDGSIEHFEKAADWIEAVKETFKK